MSRLNFKLEAEASGSKARAGRFTTLHGEVLTPIFMPVGTKASVRTLNVSTLKEVGARVLLANTYHLLIRPGAEVFRKLGGIHKFMNWDSPILTDSGGFQIFSLPGSRKMTENGAIFRSYVDGENILLSPEVSIEMQIAIGSDIMMVLDECVPSTVDYVTAKSAMEITHRWAKRSLSARADSLQSMFGIVQGACYPDLRKESAKALIDMPFDGYAIGGLAVGETKDERNDFCELVASLLPKHLPRYLMGVGTPLDLLEAVHRGVDMFDCTLPVELAQRGVAYTCKGKLQISRVFYKFKDESLDPNCSCDCCLHYSKGYLHHLIKAEEILGWQLVATHNLTFYHKLMKDMRNSILNNEFRNFYRVNTEMLSISDNVNPSFTVMTPKVDRRWSLGDYEMIESRTGDYYSIRQKSSGEVMHSVNPPMEEAKLLYIGQSRLAERLREFNPSSDERTPLPLLIWDVGLGAATNAMAAIQCHQKTESKHRMTIISFENDLTPLRLAMKNHGRFPHLFHTAPKEFLEHGHWSSADGMLEWKLSLGDVKLNFLKEEIPDLIYYDPFSYKTNGELWTPIFFESLYDHLNTSGKLVSLYTYSAATSVRGAFLYAGFYIGRGIASGPKSETTVAYTKLPVQQEERGRLVNTEWLEKWKCSDARYPIGSTIELDKWNDRIQNHPQFKVIS